MAKGAVHVNERVIVTLAKILSAILFLKGVVPVNKKVIITFAVIVIAALLLAVANHGRSPKPNAAPQKQTGTSQPAVASLQSTPAAPAQAIHASYRPLNFALLPGGFTSVDEFRQRVAKDPVLRSFYGSCADPHVGMQALPSDILVFVTFRRGNEIKWTRKPMLVHIGEYVLNFCGKTVLARCGNVVSWSPMQPSEDIPPSLLEIPTEEYRAADALALRAQPDPGPAHASVPASGGYYFFPSGTPIYVPSVGGSPMPSSPPSLAPSPTPSPTHLEGDEFVGHQALFTLLVGLFVIALLKLLAR
jgi:hypothetical protein